jgi:hypothetical protein
MAGFRAQGAWSEASHEYVGGHDVLDLPPAGCDFDQAPNEMRQTAGARFLTWGPTIDNFRPHDSDPGLI